MMGLIWVTTVCNGYQQTTLVGKGLRRKPYLEQLFILLGRTQIRYLFAHPKLQYFNKSHALKAMEVIYLSLLLETHFNMV